jgi:AmmeMemoRadiSam system protein A
LLFGRSFDLPYMYGGSCFRVNKQCLSLSILILFISLFCAGALSCGKSDNRANIKGKSPNTQDKGDKKMDEVKWLSEEEGKYLIGVARNTIKSELDNVEGPKIDWKDVPEKFQKSLGTFVTITIDGNLRGCIGHIIPRETLLEGIKQNAINAAFKDPRFPPLQKEEFNKIDIEISILTPPQELSYSDAEDLLKKLRPGIDGVIIKKGLYEATFLPQVWDQLPEKEEFLAHLCLKAGLSMDSWKTDKLQVSIYQVQAFEEER